MQNFQQGYITAADGTRLAYRDYGTDTESDVNHALPLVCLPGLTRNARDFHKLALEISASQTKPRRIVAIDYRGRGLSDRVEDKASYTIVTETQDLCALLDVLGIERAVFIGTSRGGLILHVLTSVAPERIAGLIFNDVGPELPLQGLLDIQAYLKTAPRLSHWDDAVTHLTQIHGPAFPALSDGDWQDMARDLFVETDDGIVADCDPEIARAFSAADLGAHPLPSLWEQFDQFPDVAMMVVRGENSTLLMSETVNAMQARRPALNNVMAIGQGHAPLLHLGSVSRAIADFLKEAP
ncbi:alpha/beta hydrolase [Rhizobium sp. FY34]|uniref:alpha/beta fold hydrolase n=1 Tax=Rhizobium sp. FY34 TaxID=2562309 RepID=UPI0010C04A7B|nr:alpha/beta hydrolase [Rhizobium sp. FY34]